MIDKLVAGGLSVGAVAAAGTVASETTYSTIAQFVPIITGVVCAIIVRAVTAMAATKKQVWSYNVLVGVLSSIFTAVIVHERNMTPMLAMFVGMTAGSLGVGVVNLGKQMTIAALEKTLEGLTKTPKSD